MAALNGFNAADVEPNEGFEPIPEGQYEACIVESEMKPTKSNDGQRLALTFQVLEGQYKNRKLFVNLNLHNKSEAAVKIARGELSAICRAVGVMVPNDSTELHNIPILIKVGLKKRDDNGDLQNVVKKYEAKNGTSQPKGPPSAPVAAGAPATAGSWMKK